jgi:hypothetical protein
VILLQFIITLELPDSTGTDQRKVSDTGWCSCPQELLQVFYEFVGNAQVPRFIVGYIRVFQTWSVYSREEKSTVGGFGCNVKRLPQVSFPFYWNRGQGTQKKSLMTVCPYGAGEKGEAVCSGPSWVTEKRQDIWRPLPRVMSYSKAPITRATTPPVFGSGNHFLSFETDKSPVSFNIIYLICFKCRAMIEKIGILL